MKAKPKNNKYFLYGPDSLLDKNLDNYDVLVLTSLHDTDRLGEELEQAYLKAYMETIKVLQQKLYEHNQIELAKEDPLTTQPLSCLPFLYLCKHVIELAIKYKISYSGLQKNNTHDLCQLRQNLPANIRAKLLDGDFNILIESLERIDYDEESCKKYALKYPRNTNSKENDNDIVVVNTTEVIKTVEHIFNYLVGVSDEI